MVGGEQGHRPRESERRPGADDDEARVTRLSGSMIRAGAQSVIALGPRGAPARRVRVLSRISPRYGATCPQSTCLLDASTGEVGMPANGAQLGRPGVPFSTAPKPSPPGVGTLPVPVAGGDSLEPARFGVGTSLAALLGI
jgi:hypothetical protein